MRETHAQCVRLGRSATYKLVQGWSSFRDMHRHDKLSANIISVLQQTIALTSIMGVLPNMKIGTGTKLHALMTTAMTKNL